MAQWLSGGSILQPCKKKFQNCYGRMAGWRASKHTHIGLRPEPRDRMIWQWLSGGSHLPVVKFFFQNCNGGMAGWRASKHTRKGLRPVPRDGMIWHSG